MNITVLLTAWNRPELLRKAINSVCAQTFVNWRCLVLDDGSDQDTLDMYAAIEDPRIQVHYYLPTPRERAHSTRYSVNINRWLPKLNSGIVMYMTDNTEYKPELMTTVAAWFVEHPLAFSGYVVSERDCYTMDGEYLGTAGEYNHWPRMPDRVIPFGGDMTGLLDHSQVFHRVPTRLLWDESIAAKPHGDALFYNRMIKEYGAILPIYNQPLLVEHIVK